MKKCLIILALVSGCTAIQQVDNVPVNIPSVNKPIYDYEKSINDISVGMNKREVLSILGQPLSVEANGNKECLTYPLTTANRENFVLLFLNKKLEKYNKTQKCVDLL